MITFKQARDTVIGMEERLWPAVMAGTFYVPPNGFGDDDAWLVQFGAEEWLVDEDIKFATVDADFALVSRKDGSVTTDTYLNDPDRYDRMKPANVG